MDDTPAQPSIHVSGLHPRRRPASKSVSLLHLHSKLPQSPPARPGSEEDFTMSKVTEAPVRLAYKKNSSGESSTADKWFEKSNSNVKTGHTSFDDDDPPFFLRTSSSETTPPEESRRRALESQIPAHGLPSFDHFKDHEYGGSSSEDFRSVIDDLTVQNKKLKRKLRKFEKLHNSRLHEDKLFEVRVHGLAAEKKRELQSLLRNFVTNLDRSSDANVPGVIHMPANLGKGQASSSNTSTRFGDSAYASMSISGQHGALSGQGLLTHRARRQMGMSKEQKQDIHSYLHDIPPGLLLNSSVPMSEKSRKKLVVQKLEQIFAGRDISAGYHQQPLQQQKLAQSAARADRKAIEASGMQAQEEGSREAPIMPKEGDSPDEVYSPKPVIEVAVESKGDKAIAAKKEEDVAEMSDFSDQLEQRPTRPLDLDPYRAQVPSENIKYIRHLGFSPPDVESKAVQADGHGWIYLNILTNMAQLHTVNVTAEFVRKAIQGYSDMLELSPDGRKVRWRGGTDLTILSNSNTPDQNSVEGVPPLLKRDGDSHSKDTTILSSEEATTGGQQHSRIHEKLKTLHKLEYSPLFFHKDESGSHTGNDDEATSWSSNVAGHSIGPESLMHRTHTNKQQRTDDGPIIFYNKVGFYTDLSGDPGRRQTSTSNYTRIPGDPIGVTTSFSHTDSLRRLQAEKGPISRPGIDQSPVSDNSSSPVFSADDLKVVHSMNLGNESLSPSQTIEPIDFEASGIGGVLPSDNFSISVRSRQNADVTGKGVATPALVKRSVKAYPLGIRNALEQRGSQSRSFSGHSKPPPLPLVHREIVGSKVKNLPASSLPPASYYQFSSPEEDRDDTDSDDYSESSFGSGNRPTGPSVTGPADNKAVPSTVVQRMDWTAKGNWDYSSPERRSWNVSDDNDIESSEKNDDDDDDESIDLLATARQIDPVAVRAREREFDSGIAERLAEEIPAGSSAAMADGGSGFSSPILTRDVSDPEQPTDTVKRASLKRNRKSDDSVDVRGQRARKSPKIERQSTDTELASVSS